MTACLRTLVASAALAGALGGAALPAGALAHLAPVGGVLRTITVGRSPTAIAVDARSNRAFVVNSADSTVSVIDTRSGAVLRTVAVEPPSFKADNSYLVTVDEQTGRVFVVNQQHPPARGRVITLDARSGAVLGRTTVGLLPLDMAVDARTNRVFITNLDDNTVGVLDARSGALLRTIAVGPQPDAIVVDERSGRAFVGNAGTPSISVFDTASGTVLGTHPLGHGPGGPGVMAVDARAGRIVVADQSGRVSLLDATTGVTLRTFGVGFAAGSLAVDDQIGRLFLTNSGPNFQGHSVSVLDARSGALVRTVRVGRVAAGMGPFRLVVDEHRQRVFVGNYLGNSVSVLDARSGVVIREIAVTAPFALGLDPRAGHIFVVDASNGYPTRRGYVSILDAR